MTLLATYSMKIVYFVPASAGTTLVYESTNWSRQVYQLAVLIFLNCSEEISLTYFPNITANYKLRTVNRMIPKERIRTSGQDIRGIGGLTTLVEDLDTIFLLNLYPPIPCIPDYFTQRLHRTVTPEQYIFKSVGGSSFCSSDTPRVETVYGDRTDSGEYILQGFSFKDTKS
jgi:hypothetical protein